MKQARTPLRRDRVLRAAVAVADRDGIDALTMRRLAEEVRAEAMSLYHHVANKEQILDGVIEVVLGEVNEAVSILEMPSRGAAWREAVRARALTARQVFLRHPWAPRVLESRTTTIPAALVYQDGIVGLMRDGGFTFDQIHHSMHALGSRALGFTQELFDPGGGPATDEDLQMPPGLAEALPNLTAMIVEVAHDDPNSTLGWCDDQTEFEFGLDLLLDGLERIRPA